MSIFYLLVNFIIFCLTLGQKNELNNETTNVSRSKEVYGKFEYSPEFKDLVLNMMAYNHKHRPTLEQIRNHPWMHMGDD